VQLIVVAYNCKVDCYVKLTIVLAFLDSLFSHKCKQAYTVGSSLKFSVRMQNMWKSRVRCG